MTPDQNLNGKSGATDTRSSASQSQYVMAMATDATFAIGSFDIGEASRAWLTAGMSSAEPPFYVRRVAAIRAAIDAGRYQVDAEAIADRMLDSVVQSFPRES